MRTNRFLNLAGLAVAATLVSAPVAIAQTAPAPAPAAASPERAALAAQIAHTLGEDVQASLVGALMEKAPKLDDPKVVRIIGDRGPGLYKAVRDATQAAWADSRPHVESILTHGLAEFSLEELRAGAAFLQGPDGAKVLEIYTWELTPEAKRKTLSKPAADALAHLQSTEAGRKFLLDAADKDGLLAKYRPDLVAAILPGWLLRVSDKVDALAPSDPNALATDAFAPSAEDQALGVSVVHRVLALIDESMLEKAKPMAVAAFEKKMAQQPNGAKMPRPEWYGFIATAIIDTLAKDKPTVELAFGRALARIYAHDDLKALADFTNGPAMAYYEQSVHAKPGDPKPEAPPEVKAAMDELKKHDLLAKGMGQVMNVASTDPDKKDRVIALFADLGVTLGPKIGRRFAVQAEELEARTQAGRGW